MSRLLQRWRRLCGRTDGDAGGDPGGAWRVWLMMLPTRRFTPAELARIGPDAPSAAVRGAVLVNVVLLLGMQLAVVGRGLPWGYQGVMLGLGVFTPAALELIWRDPSRPLVRWGYYLTSVGLSLVAGVMQVQLGREHREAGQLATLTVLLVVLTCWTALMYRHRVISLRLAELDERDRALELARQLGAAQIQPHFLFNTLASVQHWVSTGDARAAPLLAELTAYLRATLPLFQQGRLALGQELEAVRRYLGVMEARLGGRLRHTVSVAPEVLAAELPPGLLLTLVENAVEHGVQPQLAGGQVDLRAWRTADGLLCVQVDDDGPGLPPGPLPGAEQGHWGLANSRDRLQRAFGPAARLTLAPRPDGPGCRAELWCPCPAPGAPADAAPVAGARPLSAAAAEPAVPPSSFLPRPAP